MAEHEGKLYSRNESRVRPYFEEISIPPARKDDQLTHGHPVPTFQRNLWDMMIKAFKVTAHYAENYLILMSKEQVVSSQFANSILVIFIQILFV